MMSEGAAGRASASAGEALAVAGAEARELWRSTRAWVFVVLLVGATLLAFVVGSRLHGAYSAEHPLVGFLGAPFFMSRFGVYLLALGLAGAALVAFRARAGFGDLGGVAETVACRPVSTLVLLGGRVFALVATTWLSIVAALAVAQGVGAVGVLVEPALIEPVSIASFLFVDALPATMFWCVLVVLIHVVVRNRFLAVLLALTLLALLWRIVGELPAWAFSAVVPVGSIRHPVSDMAP